MFSDNPLTVLDISSLFVNVLYSSNISLSNFNALNISLKNSPYPYKLLNSVLNNLL
jgi:hypothetical protein